MTGENYNIIFPEKMKQIYFGTQIAGGVFIMPTSCYNVEVNKATNAYRCGQTSRIKVFVDKDGRLRHERQHGHHVTDKEAKEMGWVKKLSLPKNRYVFIVGTNRADIRYWKKKCLLLKSLT
jgi:hypothetical protein